MKYMKPNKQSILRLLLPVMMMAFTLPLHAQDGKPFSLELNGETLPTALKRIEKAGGKNIIFSYNETESYRVNASIREKTEAEAIRMVLHGTPFTCKEREDYFVVQRKGKTTRTIAIRGNVSDERNAPLAYSNVVMFTAEDSLFVNGCVTAPDGSFTLTAEEGTDYLLTVSYIGYKTLSLPCRDYNAIRMTPDTQLMQEVTVTARRPLIEQSPNGLKANVKGTTLARMGTAAEMIAHLPFVTGSEGDYKVLGHGTPVIYINSRKVRNPTDLEHLRADEILSAEIITTPGAEYGPDVRAVICIRTARQRGQGLSGNFMARYSQGKEYNANENISLNYRTGGLDLFAKGYASHGGRYQHTTLHQTLEGASHWEADKDVTKRMRKGLYVEAEVGFNYEVDEHHSFGMRYMPSNNLGADDNAARSHGTTHVTQDGKDADYIDYTSVTRNPPRWEHSVNGYYNGEIGPYTIDFNADYLGSRNTKTQEVTNNGEETVSSQNRVRNSLYAARLVVSRQWKTSSLSVGTEETFTNRHDLFTQSGFSADANDHIRQSVWSVFANYSLRVKALRINAGLRYEHQQTDYYVNDAFQPEQSPTYDDLIPVLAAQYSHRDWDFGLSYRLMKINPGYEMLASAVTYQTKYEYSNGNPYLVPQKHHYVNAQVSHKWLSATAYFDKTRNMYTSYYKPYNDQTHPGVLLRTNASIPVTYTYGLHFELAPQIGCWQPRFGMGVDWFDSDASSLGITEFQNEGRFSFSLDNHFSLPHGWFLNLQGNISPGCRQSYAVWKTSGRINLRLSKSFLKEEALTVTLTGNDILHTGYRYFHVYGVRSFQGLTEYSDSQRFGIQLSYKFNATKNKYKGTGAGESEKQRL